MATNQLGKSACWKSSMAAKATSFARITCCGERADVWFGPSSECNAISCAGDVDGLAANYPASPLRGGSGESRTMWARWTYRRLGRWCSREATFHQFHGAPTNAGPDTANPQVRHASTTASAAAMNSGPPARANYFGPTVPDDQNFIDSSADRSSPHQRDVGQPG